MKLFDTATQDTTTLSVGSEALIYVCGITPYDSAHLGHAFTFLTYDLLLRRLEDTGTRVRLVRNITDVDEPMYVKAAQLGVHYLELARIESAEFSRSMRALNLVDPDVEPRPSEHMDVIIDSVRQLKQGGHTYEIDGDIYFDISTFPDFGEISGYSERLMHGFTTLRGGDPERMGKRQPLDFLLWKSIKDESDPARWETTLGPGRPGWHIECSAMSFAHLGPTIDVHGGGFDLIFPHHECENAQSRTLRKDVPFVRHWMHTAPLGLGGEKMSKSLGNLVFVRDLVKETDPAAIRLALMNYHYRIGGEWKSDLLQSSVQTVERIKYALNQPTGGDVRQHLARIRAALDNDLDAPSAARALTEMVDAAVNGSSSVAADTIKEALNLLGLKIEVATS
ncbi:MAG: class I tRNA ligase family protein [Actinophytocola sp.]|uniref:class I tRNA ligase family protein n=1 Tax=Actinophytocola sp. TaxID=1872138 RepID=UPI003C719697